MVTISVSLDDETYARLKAVAEAEGVSVEDLVAGSVTSQYCPSAVSSEVRALIDRQLESYRPVFRRLAQ